MATVKAVGKISCKGTGTGTWKAIGSLRILAERRIEHGIELCVFSH